VTTTVKKGRTSKSAPKAKVGPKQAPMTKLNSSTKPKEASEPKKPVVPTQSPLEEISDLLDKLSSKACAELTRRLLTSLPPRPAPSHAVLKIVILFVAEYGGTA
jgi:hypothetical protein